MTASAAETVRLATFLEAANQQDIPIVFSSALVRGYYKVTYDPDSPITLEDINNALAGFDLKLTAIPGGYAATRQPKVTLQKHCRTRLIPLRHRWRNSLSHPACMNLHSAILASVRRLLIKTI